MFFNLFCCLLSLLGVNLFQHSLLFLVFNDPNFPLFLIFGHQHFLGFICLKTYIYVALGYRRHH